MRCDTWNARMTAWGRMGCMFSVGCVLKVTWGKVTATAQGRLQGYWVLLSPGGQRDQKSARLKTLCACKYAPFRPPVPSLQVSECRLKPQTSFDVEVLIHLGYRIEIGK